MRQPPAVRLMAEETGQSLAEVGTTTARPPWHAVPMGALAGRPFEPAKRSSMHARHRELGANVLWAGDLRRANDYGDARAEALAVHEAACVDRRLHPRVRPVSVEREHGVLEGLRPCPPQSRRP